LGLRRTRQAGNRSQGDLFEPFTGASPERGKHAPLRRLGLGLAQAASRDLDEEVAEEGALEDLLDPAYAVVPRTTELAVQRGQKL